MLRLRLAAKYPLVNLLSRYWYWKHSPHESIITNRINSQKCFCFSCLTLNLFFSNVPIWNYKLLQPLLRISGGTWVTFYFVINLYILFSVLDAMFVNSKRCTYLGEAFNPALLFDGSFSWERGVNLATFLASCFEKNWS